VFFYEKPWFSRGLHLAMGNPPLTFADWAKKFFVDTYDYISEVVLRIFKNLTYFFFTRKIHKGFCQDLFFDLQNPIN